MIINNSATSNFAQIHQSSYNNAGTYQGHKDGSSKVHLNESQSIQEAQKAPLGPLQISEKEKKEVAELKKRDAEVRNHERAHMAAGGPYVRGGASYEMKQGPDGRSYAVGGEVSIDVSPVNGDPDATIRKMQTVRRAALAPADPSPQDRAVAAQTAKVENEARIEKSKMEKEESDKKAEPENSSTKEAFALSQYKQQESESRIDNVAGRLITTFA